MRFDYFPSLERICGVKIAASLWNHNILSLNTIDHSLSAEERIKRLAQINREVDDNVRSISITRNLNQRNIDLVRMCARSYVKPLGIEFLMWKEYEYNKWKLNLPLPNEIKWTNKGILDRKKMAIVLIKDGKLDIINRYKLACIYCLKDYVSALWYNMNIRQKEKIHEELSIIRIVTKYEIAFWTYYLFGNLNKLIRKIYIPKHYLRKISCPYVMGFLRAVNDGNKVSAEYFFGRMSLEQKQEHLVQSTQNAFMARFSAPENLLNFDVLLLANKPKVSYTEILCFLLSKMEETQQINMFRNRALYLACFLDWPWQPCFMELAKRIRNFFYVKEFMDLLWYVIIKHGSYYWDMNYLRLFSEIWEISPKSLKETFLNELACRCNDMLDKLVRRSLSSEFLKIVFKDVPIIRKQQIIFSRKEVCFNMVCQERPKLVELTEYLKNLSTKETIIQFKNECQNIVANNPRLQQFNNKLPKLFEILDSLYNMFQRNESNNQGTNPLNPIIIE